VDARVLSASGLTRFDDGPIADTRSDVDTALYSFGVQGQVMPAWNTRLSYSSSEDTSVQLASASAFTPIPSKFATTQKQWNWKNEVKTPLGLVIAGIEQLTQKVDSTTNYTVKERRVNSLYAGLNGSTGAHSWQVNARQDRNSQFGNSTTGFAGYGFALSPHWRLQASHGTSFVAPSFNQLYFPNFGVANLQPEKGRNTDVGVTFSQSGHSVKLVHFDNKIRGFITNTTLAANIPRARIDGWTLGYEGALGAWRLNASIDSIDPRNELTGKILPRRSKTQMQLGGRYDAGIWSAGADVLKVGDRFDNATNTAAAAIAGYTTVDLNASYQLAKAWALQGKINNLTDRSYETALGFNQPRRGLFVSLRYAPK
jgi:vitamin B12 transporter